MDILETLSLPQDQYMMTGSVWLAIMSIRKNKDIDIILTEKLRKEYSYYLDKLEPSAQKAVRFCIDISSKHSRRIVDIAKVNNVDDLIRDHHVEIDGYQLVQYDLFRKYKKPRKGDKHKKDRKEMDRFFGEKKDLLPEYKGMF